MYIPDSAVLLRRLTALVKPGGIVALHELDLDAAKSEPACPVFDTTVRRIRQTFMRSRVDARIGLKLEQIFKKLDCPRHR